MQKLNLRLHSRWLFLARLQSRIHWNFQFGFEFNRFVVSLAFCWYFNSKKFCFGSCFSVKWECASSTVSNCVLQNVFPSKDILIILYGSYFVVFFRSITIYVRFSNSNNVHEFKAEWKPFFFDSFFTSSFSLSAERAGENSIENHRFIWNAFCFFFLIKTAFIVYLPMDKFLLIFLLLLVLFSPKIKLKMIKIWFEQSKIVDKLHIEIKLLFLLFIEIAFMRSILNFVICVVVFPHSIH